MARKSQATRLRKIQFTVDQDTVQKLEESREINRDPSLAQSFRRAAALAAFFDKMRRDGYEIVMRKGEDVFKVFVP